MGTQVSDKKGGSLQWIGAMPSLPQMLEKCMMRYMTAWLMLVLLGALTSHP